MAYLDDDDDDVRMLITQSMVCWTHNRRICFSPYRSTVLLTSNKAR
jgi:hypothetical protein